MESIKVSYETKKDLEKIKKEYSLKSFNETIEVLIMLKNNEVKETIEEKKIYHIDRNIETLLQTFNSFLNACDKTLLEDEQYDSKEHLFLHEAKNYVNKQIHKNKINKK